MRSAATILSVLVCLLATAGPARAGESVEGRGWSVDVPDGFVEIESMEGGLFNSSSLFSTLPVERVPDRRAFLAGDASEPKGVLIISRMDLSQEVLSTDQLGMDRLHLLKEALPVGARIDAATVGKWNAIEFVFRQDEGWNPMTARALGIAAGDYLVVVVLLTSDEAYPQAEAMWSSMKSSIEVSPPVNSWLLFGIVGAAALAILIVLGRVGSRQVRDIPDHEGRWKRQQDGLAEGMGAVGSYKPMQTGVRPKVLSSAAPRFDAGGPADTGALRTPGRPTPAPTATDASVTRPSTKAPSERKGLRTTRPSSGRYGA